jgi:hypothetical protein
MAINSAFLVDSISKCLVYLMRSELPNLWQVNWRITIDVADTCTEEADGVVTWVTVEPCALVSPVIVVKNFC